VGEYFPVAPNSDEARRHNENLPGLGGIYNYVNMHVYHYGGNNPIRYTDPDGKWIAFSKQIERFKRHLNEAEKFGSRQYHHDQQSGARIYINTFHFNIQRRAENAERGSLFRFGMLSWDIRRAGRSMGLDRNEMKNYRREEMARYKAFKELRKNSSNLAGFDAVVETAQEEFNNVLQGRNSPEARREADAAANKIIDDFIQSRNPQYRSANDELQQ
jgi:DNA phosphorothioation-dependent restriction protein DptG